jgi:hypothetical protein
MKKIKKKTGKKITTVKKQIQPEVIVEKPKEEKKVLVEKGEQFGEMLIRKPATYFVLAAIILGVLVGRMYVTPQQAKEPSVSSLTFPKNSREIPKAITLKPAHADDLQLYVSDGLTPLQMPDLVTYQRGGGLMVISSRDLPVNAIRNKGLDEVDQLLDGKTNPDMNIIAMSFFASPAGSGAVSIMRELSDISYPKTDKSRVFMTTFAQNIYPSLFIQVYAKKGNQYVQLSKRISDSDTEDNYINFCNAAVKDQDSDESSNCYWSMLSSDAQLKDKAQKTAKELISTFAL